MIELPVLKRNHCHPCLMMVAAMYKDVFCYFRDLNKGIDSCIDFPSISALVLTSLTITPIVLEEGG